MSEVQSIETAVEYRDIPGLDGFRVGSDGTIWSEWKRRGLGYKKGTEAYRSGEWHQIKLSLAGGNTRRDGRKAVRYWCFDAKRKTTPVHKCVLLAFVGPRPEGHECRHLDGNPLNNRLENLKWGTCVENNLDRITHGTMPYGENNKNHKLTSEQVDEIRRLRASGIALRTIAKRFDVRMGTIWYIVHGITRKNG